MSQRTHRQDPSRNRGDPRNDLRSDLRNDPPNDFMPPLSDILMAAMPNLANIMGSSPMYPTPNLPQSIPVDIVNEENVLYIYAEIPGIDKDKINVEFYNQRLVLTTEKIRTYNTPGVSERKFGKAQRSITLPICVTKQETVSLNYKDGVLEICIKKFLEEENKFSMKPP